MADEDDNEGEPEPDETEGNGEPEGAEPDANGDPSGADGGGSEDFEQRLDALEDKLEAEREQRRQAESELEELHEERQKRREEELDEQEKLEQELEQLREEREQLQQEARQQRIERELERAASEADLRNPHRTLKLVNRDEITINDDGEVVGAKAAVEELREEMPDLFGDPAPASTSSPESGSSKPSDKETADEGEPESDFERGRRDAKSVQQESNEARL